MSSLLCLRGRGRSWPRRGEGVPARPLCVGTRSAFALSYRTLVRPRSLWLGTTRPWPVQAHTPSRLHCSALLTKHNPTTDHMNHGCIFSVVTSNITTCCPYHSANSRGKIGILMNTSHGCPEFYTSSSFCALLAMTSS